MEAAWRRGTVLALVLVIVASGALAAPAATDGDAWKYGRCIKDPDSKELYGPTDVNAQSANGGLAAGVNDEGTVTVLRYPRPSFYDQVRYHTTDRHAERMGAAENAGIFLGVAVRDADVAPWTVSWLRDWSAEQSVPSGFTDVVRTTHRNATLDLTVTVRDVVAEPGTDVLARHLTVEQGPGAPEQVRVLAFENLNLVVSKTPYFPTQDWCQEEENADHARYDGDHDALVHEKTGVDRSTGEVQQVALALGFGNASAGHQVGGDATIATGRPDARHLGPTQDAYLDAGDGELRGHDAHVGQTTGALARDLTFQGDTAHATLLLTGASTPIGAVSLLEEARDRGAADLQAEKAAWLDSVLAEAPMPNATAPPAVQELAHRALVTLVTNFDPRSGALVASISTQSPYGEDWIRDGAYFNEALHLLGLDAWVEQRNRWYADLQQAPGDPQPDAFVVPPGAWAMNYYADGVPGGPIPWEIDEVGYGAWTLWRHYEATGDQAYLEDVYPAIRRAGDLLVRHRDPTTGLHAPAWEDDVPQPKRTIVGASTAWMGLQAAEDAAEALGRTEDAQRFETRRAELGDAIRTHLWDPSTGSYGPHHPGHAETAWPVCFTPDGSSRLEPHLDAVWRGANASFNGARSMGAYESKALLALALRDGDDPARMEDVRQGLTWVATEHATSDTRVLGEFWVQEEGEVEGIIAQPHTWEQVLFYLASLQAWPADGGTGSTVGLPCAG